MLVLGAIHGNETCGPAAIQRVLRQVQAQQVTAIRGKVTFVPICNPDAFERGRRYSVRDLNRNFGPVDDPVAPVDHYANALTQLMASADVLLDLHSFRAAGPPFVFLGPQNNTETSEPFCYADQELEFAQSLGIERMVYGWLAAFERFVARQNSFLSRPENAALGIRPEQSTLGRGTTEYFRSLGRGYGVSVECGNHSDAESVAVAASAILRACGHLGIMEPPQVLSPGFSQVYEFSEIYLREHVHDCLVGGVHAFAEFRKGDLLAVRASGQQVVAPQDGATIFAYETAGVGRQWLYYGTNSSRGVRATNP